MLKSHYSWLFLIFFVPPSVSFSILLIIQVLWFFCDQIKVIQYLIDESTVLLEKINSASSPEIDEKILVQYGGSDSLTPQVAMARLRLQVRNETYTNKQLINPKKRAFWNSSSICSIKYAISEEGFFTSRFHCWRLLSPFLRNYRNELYLLALLIDYG